MPNFCLCTTDTVTDNVAGDRRFRIVAHPGLIAALPLYLPASPKQEC